MIQNDTQKQHHTTHGNIEGLCKNARGNSYPIHTQAFHHLFPAPPRGPCRPVVTLTQRGPAVLKGCMSTRRLCMSMRDAQDFCQNNGHMCVCACACVCVCV